MPLSKIQTEVLRLLASHRDPESYVAGATPLNRNAPRYSGDIGVFHDREEGVAKAVEQDTAALQEKLKTAQTAQAAMVDGRQLTQAEDAKNLDFDLALHVTHDLTLLARADDLERATGIRPVTFSVEPRLTTSISRSRMLETYAVAFSPVP